MTAVASRLVKVAEHVPTCAIIDRDLPYANERLLSLLPAVPRRFVLALTSATLCFGVAFVSAQAPPPSSTPAVQPPLPTGGARSDTVTLNFVNAEVDAVVRAVAEITGRNFIVDPRVKGTINIVSARPIPRSLVYPTLLSALRLAGFAAVESDGLVKIVPEADAKTQGGVVGRGSGDRLVTQVIQLRNESAAQLVNVLRPLITPNNTIAAFPGSNALIITDYADNLRRIERIIASLDQPSASEPLLVPVRHASALDIVALVNRLLVESPQPGGTPVDATQRVMLVADPRSNSILVRSENPARAARVRQLIEQLDTPGRVGGNLFIIYLKNADATRVAQTLRSLLAGGSDAGSAPVAPALAPATTLSPAQTTGTAPIVQAPPLPFTQATPPSGFTAGGVTVQADAANNALIVMAPEPIYNNLRAIVEKLDVRRAQVYVEALIVEVSADKAAELGIQWQALSGLDSNRTRLFGGTNFNARGSGTNIIDIAVNPLSAAPGLNLGIIRGQVNLPFGQLFNLAFLARALETQVGANILSTPALLTLDNEEARIVVGQNVPFVTGQYATTGGTTTVAPFQTIERRDVGLVLRVRPQITEGGAVRMVIYQEVSRIQDQSQASGIILSKRSLESSVVVDDSQVVVLGGLIEDRLSDSADKVPVLGDVPGVGTLFRYDGRRREKTNLMVFLKPTVLRTGQDGRAITSERYEYLMNEQARTAPGALPFWRDPTVPQLPPQGTMPGTPGAAPIVPTDPPHPLAPLVPK
ncbi:MAG TPA: type II secretion system secretin GspD [Casimicrobiaceae bacterium]|nr:type II secretion system secretin GspD [Casimicrobiaceae bacterium]